MDSISNVQSLLPTKDMSSIVSRAIASFRGEIDRLIATTAETAATPAAPHLGINVDTKA